MKRSLVLLFLATAALLVAAPLAYPQYQTSCGNG